MDFKNIIAKAKDFAGKNPDKVRDGIDKAEAVVDEKTGGKYSAQVDQAGDWVEGQLGLPNNTNNPAEPATPVDPEATPVDPDAPTDPMMPTQDPTIPTTDPEAPPTA